MKTYRFSVTLCGGDVTRRVTADLLKPDCAEPLVVEAEDIPSAIESILPGLRERFAKKPDMISMVEAVAFSVIEVSNER